MYRKKTIVLVFIAAIVLAMNACYYDKEQMLYPVSFNCNGTAPSFSTEVLPLITGSCSQGMGCHGAGSTNGPGALTTFNEIKNAGTQVLSSVKAGRMPLGSSLTAAQIKTINCWVTNGMLNN
ncbi:hypothetical protein Q4E93_19870 [Flavitalea sp. BT771]|uniref:hypothetical protein n=1 Tax=Flavitalea sp. BT771 TaxID=3063329 RepID=UPI0026E2263F|nr:hypothetical protein [Flavitalea sp. BT771]MDO6432876.1 hypothetical protein [Flavitalea sp. BT771]MDV6221848.1 hypothetical protein [Flavitalea sp. BT771]